MVWQNLDNCVLKEVIMLFLQLKIFYLSLYINKIEYVLWNIRQ